MKCLTREQVIARHCKSRIYDCSSPGHWRQQVTLCAAYDCNLWSFRPVSRSDLPEPLLDAHGFADAQKRLFRGPKRDFFATRDSDANPR